MFGAGAGHTESYFTPTLFHITESFFVTSHHESFFLRVFEAAYAEKASSSFLRILSFFRSATVFTAHFGGRRAVIGREGKRERRRANCVPVSFSLVGLKQKTTSQLDGRLDWLQTYATNA